MGTKKLNKLCPVLHTTKRERELFRSVITFIDVISIHCRECPCAASAREYKPELLEILSIVGCISISFEKELKKENGVSRLAERSYRQMGISAARKAVELVEWKECPPILMPNGIRGTTSLRN